ncbi:MAG TPA: VTT domain-containing protein [Terracidiphilus sp.]|jgi:membrane protein DedA with SNARE-associated domain/rhodanese-related sulfurtransferase|nr:VTT domain-containing protein [Terracidiphilus sp.]
MSLPTHILLMYGYLLVFAWVLVEQVGLPLPATPVLLAAGALSAERQLSFIAALAAGVVACLISDSTWFFIGRRYGRQVLNLLCRMSLEPTICVKRTQLSFGRRRHATLMLGKFVPGLASLTSPIAGQNGMPYAEFLFLDFLGATIWVGALLAGGRVFGDALNRDPRLLAWVGRFSGALLLIAIVAWVAGRVYRRRRLLRQLAGSRLEPQELLSQMDAGEEVYIVDLRHPLEQLTEPFTLRGALRVAPDDLARRVGEIPRDRDIILYCTCPNEETAAHTALKLHRLGVERVRPLRGGYEEWKRLGYPMDAIPEVMPGPVSAAGLVQLEG